jgi:transposase
MGNEIRADYTRQFLLPPSLEEWIPIDHPARFIRDFVDSLDLAALGFRIPKAFEGRPPYAADLQLKVWLYGYMNRIRSTRDLERACREHMSLLWLTGQNYPDHNTLWRFFSVNKKVFRCVFRQVIIVAYDSGLVGMAVHAVDGTKIRAQSSKRSGHHKKELEKLLKHIDASIDEAISEIESSETSESGEYRLPDSLIDAKARRSEIKKSLAKLSEIDRAHYHPGESDARMMKTGEGIDFGYNAQVVVDRESSLIIAEDVVNAEADNALLMEMIDEVEDNLGEAASETVGDGGYYSPNQLAEAEQRGREVLVPLPGNLSSRGKFHKSQFRYDEKNDEYICPEGKQLKYKGTRLSRHKKYKIREYRCRNYKDCPYCWKCSSQKRGRTIERGEYETSVLRQKEKQKSESKQGILKSRMSIVESTFAHIKEQMGFRRWTMRNLENVRPQWSLMCTAINLKKLYRHWLEGRLILAK